MQSHVRQVRLTFEFFKNFEIFLYRTGVNVTSVSYSSPFWLIFEELFAENLEFQIKTQLI